MYFNELPLFELPEDDATVLPYIKAYLFENKDHPDILKEAGTITACVIEMGVDINEFSNIAHSLGYDFLTIIKHSDVSIPHLAAMYKDNAALTLFKKLGVDLEAKNSQGFTPLYLAMHAGNYETTLHLQQLGCKLDPSFPIIRKIGQEEFYELLNGLESCTVNIRELLISRGFEPNLDYNFLVFDDKFTYIDFSGMSLVSAEILFDKANMSFENANLENAKFYCNLPTIDLVNLKQANLKRASGIIGEGLYKSLSSEQVLKSHFYVIEEDRFFSQDNLIETLKIKDRSDAESLSDGLCLGLSFEYCRHILRNVQKGTQGDLDKNFIDKLHSKLNDPIGDTVERISTYQKIFQGTTNRKLVKVALNLDTPQTLKTSLSELCDPEFIRFSFYHHSIALRSLKDQAPDDIIEYTIFDPNRGVSKRLNLEGLHTELLKLHAWYNEEDSLIYAVDLGKEILELGLINGDRTTYNKDSKNIHKLFAALKAEDIELIKALSAVQKIDSGNHSTLKFAIRNGSEEALIELINNNTKLDLSSIEDIQLIIIGLRISGKLSQPVLEALSQKAQEFGALEGKAIIDEAILLKNNNQEPGLYSNGHSGVATDTAILPDEDVYAGYIDGTVLHAPLN